MVINHHLALTWFPLFAFVTESHASQRGQVAGRGKGVRWPSLRRQMEQRWRLVSSSRRQSSRCHHEGKGQGTLKSRFKALTSGKDWD